MKHSYPKPLLVLVHPGSLCGSYQTAHDWHKDWGRYAKMRREQLCAEFTFLDAYKAVLLGPELDDEVPRYPNVQVAVSSANRRYNAGDTETGLIQAAQRTIRDFSDRANSIIVTGAWADRASGCAWTVYKELRRLSRNPPTLSETHLRKCVGTSSGTARPLNGMKTTCATTARKHQNGKFSAIA